MTDDKNTFESTAASAQPSLLWTNINCKNNFYLNQLLRDFSRHMQMRPRAWLAMFRTAYYGVLRRKRRNMLHGFGVNKTLVAQVSK